MTDRSILFSAPMVRSIIAEAKQPGTGKTQTRRVLELPEHLDPASAWADPGIGAGGYLKADASDGETTVRVYPRWEVRDRLWVKETWASDGHMIKDRSGEAGVRYAATDDIHELRRRKPSIFMPRTASRLTLTVTAVRVERLQDITETDASDEGAPCGVMDDEGKFYPDLSGTYRCGFAGLWRHINSKRPGADWDDNPWVVAITFKPALCNIDSLEAVAA